MSRRVNTTTSPFAAKLREAQAEIGVTSEALARQIGVTLRLVQRWRAGSSEPGGENLVALAAAVDREASWFYAIEPADPSAEAAA